LSHEVLIPLQERYPDNPGLLNALAYLYESQQQLIPTLSIYQHLLELNPGDTNILRQKILSLNKIGASHLASRLANNPAAFSKEDLASIKTNMSAHQIRWAEISAEDEKHHFDEIDIAIIELEANIKGFRSQFGNNSSYTLNAQFDLLVALRNRYRMNDSIKLYEELIASNTKIPAYAQIAACDAYLYLERPNDAESCYLYVKQKRPEEDINLDLSLYYAYVENEKMKLAQSWTKDFANKNAPYITGKGKKPHRRPNPKKTQAATISALSIAYADNLEVSEQQIKALHQLAPFNTELRKELANIDYWRGWTRKAQEEYDIGLSQQPKNLGLRIGEARNQLALKYYAQANESIGTLFKLFPEDKGVAIQNELWSIHNMREFKTEISTSNSSGSGSVNGSRGLDINSYLYSRPLSKNYRVYIHQRHSQAKFAEGDGLNNHAGIGLEYTAPNIFLMTEIHHNHYENNRLGINLNGTYEFDDHWSSSFALESLSAQTPLRALNQGVYAKSASWGGQYRWHESRSTGLNLSYLDFSDDNTSKSINGFWQERWYSQYTYKFSTRVDLFSSRNSEENVIYFNPESDLAGSIAFENDWLTWRNYEDSFHQRLILSTGFYNQENYSTGDTWGLQYEHRWAADYRLEVVYGVKRSSNLYDGDDELSWSYYFLLDWRF